MPQIIPFVIAFAIDLAFGAGIAGTVLFGGLTIGTLVTGIVTLGAVVGAAALLRPGRPSAAQNFQAPTPVSVTVGAQSVGGQFFVVGEKRVGGIFAYRRIAGGRLLYAMVINCEKVAGVVAHVVDDEVAVTHAVDFPPGGLMGDGSPAPVAVTAGQNIVRKPTQGLKFAATLITVPYNGQFVQIPGPPIAVAEYEFRNATEAGARSAILSYYVPDVWTEDFKMQGLAVAYSAYSGTTSNQLVTYPAFRTVYPNNAPQEGFVLRGLLYDPRNPAHVFGDIETWSHSKNPALAWARLWTHPYFGNKPYDEIDWDSVKAAADYCDREVVSFVGGVEPFAEMGAQWNTMESIDEIETKILAACDGLSYENGDKLAIWILQDFEPTVTLRASDFSSLSWNETAGAFDECNVLQGIYCEPRINDANLATPEIIDQDSIDRVGERAQTLPLEYVRKANQAYRIAHRVFHRINPPRIVHGVLLPSGRRALRQFAIRIDAPECGLVGKFMPSKLADVATGGTSMGVEFYEVADTAFVDVVMPEDPVSPSLGGVSSLEAHTVLVPTAIPFEITWDGVIPTIAASAHTWQVQNGTPINIFSPPAQGTPVDEALEFHIQSRPVDPGTHQPLGDGTWRPAAPPEDRDLAILWGDYSGPWVLLSPTGAVAVSHSYELRAWFVLKGTGTVGQALAGVFVDVPSGP